MEIKINTQNYSGDVAKRLNYIKSGPPLAVFTDSFMKSHTSYKCISDFVKASKCTSDNIVDGLNDEAYLPFIRENSIFSSWQ